MTIVYFTAIPILAQPITVGKWREQKLFWTDRYERLYICTTVCGITSQTQSIICGIKQFC